MKHKLTPGYPVGCQHQQYCDEILGWGHRIPQGTSEVNCLKLDADISTANVKCDIDHIVTWKEK